MELIYEVSDEETMIKDFKILKDGFTLMQIDYLGGSGSRGYGRVKITDLDLDMLIGDVSDENNGSVPGSFRRIKEQR